MTGGPSVVFTRKAVVDETFVRDSPIIWKLNVGVDATQLDHFSMCQDIMSTGLGGATSLDSFPKAFKLSETKFFFPHEWFDSADKLENQKLPPYKAFFSKLRGHNNLE